jgi:hypothetical protein
VPSPAENVARLSRSISAASIEWERMDHALMRWLSENSPNFKLIHDAYYGAFLAFETAEEAERFKERWLSKVMK